MAATQRRLHCLVIPRQTEREYYPDTSQSANLKANYKMWDLLPTQKLPRSLACHCHIHVANLVLPRQSYM